MDKIKAIEERLHRNKDYIQNRIQKIERDLKRQTNPLEKDFAEQATQRENDEVLEGLLISSREELKKINVALKRIGEDEYLRCEVCGDEIPIARLEAVPYTNLCIRCAERAQAASK